MHIRKELMMPFSQIVIEKSDGIYWITLNRPEAMNALTPVMLRELRVSPGFPSLVTHAEYEKII
jgi:1,4-dihydroxy-2-naphthoyl-CoA synthase